MIRYLSLVVLLLLNLNTSSQEINNDSSTVTFSFKKFERNDSISLPLKIFFRNKTNRSILIYSQLREGRLGDHLTNIYIECEVLRNREYHPKSLRYYQSIGYKDSLRHFDMPKKKLLPYASDSIELNLLDISGLDKGEYRFRAHLRSKTEQNNEVYNADNYDLAPPQDRLYYITSDWFYFTLNKRILGKYISPDL